MDSATIIQIVLGLGTAGVAFGAVKAGLNGTRENVKEIHRDLKAHIADEEHWKHETIERLVKVETKVDLINKK